MASSNPSSTEPSRVSTPNRFTAQASTAEDLLKSQTVGLVHLSDFRKRRAEALEQKEREATGSSVPSGATAGGFGRFAPAGSPASGAATPNSIGSHDRVATPGQERPPKRKRKTVAKGKLSFGIEEDGGDEYGDSNVASTPATTKSNTPALDDDLPSRNSPTPPNTTTPNGTTTTNEKKRLGPNTTLLVAPKAMTKSALLREAQTREQLRKEFLGMQEAVKATEIIIPFVFYDGTNIPGGACKVKKGDYIWLFLDRSRKVGAELGVGGSAGGGGGGGGGGRGRGGREKANARREWARVGVDDLMLVRGEVIIPHHYEIYHFIANKTLGPNGRPLFGYESVVAPPPRRARRSRSQSPDNDDEENEEEEEEEEEEEKFEPLSQPASAKETAAAKKWNGVVTEADRGLEGVGDDPTFTKVVDRRWYERNKHIFPASVWEEFDPGKDYVREVRKDALGNAFFFS